MIEQLPLEPVVPSAVLYRMAELRPSWGHVAPGAAAAQLSLLDTAMPIVYTGCRYIHQRTVLSLPLPGAAPPGRGRANVDGGAEPGIALWRILTTCIGVAGSRVIFL